MSITITTNSRTVLCPFWDTEVTLTGKYKVLDDYTFSFMYSTCEIVENAKLPYNKQDKNLSWYIPCKICPCKELELFPKVL